MEIYQCIVCNECFPTGFSELLSGETGICPDCYRNMDKFKTPMALDEMGVTCISAYPYTGILRKAFLRYKFFGEQAYHRIFAVLFSDTLPLRSEDFDIVIPVPISRQRMNERGYNQTALFAKIVAKKMGLEYSEPALLRKRNTQKQSMLAARDRLKNVEDAFYADYRVVEGKRVLLIDDIHTVGATMYECAKTLKNAGAKSVVGAVLFKSIKTDD